MDGVLDLSAKNKHDSDRESNSSPSADGPSSRDGSLTSPAETFQNKVNISSPPNSQESSSRLRHQNPFSPNANPAPMFYPNYPNYSLLANRYLALHHQMFSTFMASQMHPGMPWMFPGPIQNPLDGSDKTAQIVQSPFFQKFPIDPSGKHTIPTSLSPSQTNFSEFPTKTTTTTTSKCREQASTKRRTTTDHAFNETKHANPPSDGSSSSFETISKKPPKKKFRPLITDTATNHLTPTPRPTNQSNQAIESTLETLEDCNSSDSKYDRNPQSENSNESRGSARSDDDSMQSSSDQREHSDSKFTGYSFQGTLAGQRQSAPRTSQEESDFQCSDPNLQEYREKRRKNNAAAKKSRDQRRIQEESINRLAAQLKEENIRLRTELLQRKARSAELEKFLERRSEIKGKCPT